MLTGPTRVSLLCDRFFHMFSPYIVRGLQSCRFKHRGGLGRAIVVSCQGGSRSAPTSSLYLCFSFAKNHKLWLVVEE